MRAEPNLFGRIWYTGVYWSSFTAFTFGFSYRKSGWHHMPKSGPVLVLSNHFSMFDPVLVGLASRRYLSYLARKNLFEQRGLAPLIRSLNAIPIDREAGKDGLVAVLDSLSAGRAVLMFPEGERAHENKVQELKPGVSLLVKKAACPVVPVGIAGSFGAWSRFRKLPKPSPLLLPPTDSTIAVSVGAPLDGTRLAGLKRDALLAELQDALVRQHAHAEHIRRK